MRTHLGPSKLPGGTGDAFHLEYSHFNDLKRGGLGGAFLHTMFDEVRKVGPGLYLGIGRGVCGDLGDVFRNDGPGGPTPPPSR